MGRPSIRSIRALLFVALGSALATSVHAQAEEAVTPAAVTTTQTVAFEIPAQPLSSALMLFSEQAGVQVTMQGEGASQTFANAVAGSLSADDALAQMLQGTGLTASRTGPNTFAIQGTANPGGAAASPLDGSGTASVEMARRGGVEEIIVTGQKKAERLQDVPIAISAFSMESLDAQKIEGGFDLLKAVPNVTFSKTNFSGYNFQIRGIGTQAVSATTDPGVAVSFNNTTLIVNRLFEQEYLDIERVEVLRGPQGTLYGRNATGGVINVISAKPVLGEQFGEIKLEGGNFGAQRVRGHYNLPLGDTFAIRAAYASTVRDGYGKNEAAGQPGINVSRDVDDRDLWTGRISLGWEPTDRIRANLIWEHFEEDDARVRTSKQLCHHDPIPEDINGVSVGQVSDGLLTAVLSQGCQAGSLYSEDAYGTVFGASLPYVLGPYFAVRIQEIGFSQARRYGIGGNFYADPNGDKIGGGLPEEAPCADVGADLQTYAFDICNPNPYGGAMQSRDLRTIYSEVQPQYFAESDVIDFSVDFQLTDELLLTSQTVYAKDEYYATQDYNRFASQPFWNDGKQACGVSVVSGKTNIDCSDDPINGQGTFLPLTDVDGIRPVQQGMRVGETTVDDEGFLRDADGRRIGYYAALFADGQFCDPQLGCSTKLVAQDLSRASSKQFNQELRLVSSFESNINFSLGANFTRFETYNDYFVFSNSFTSLLHFWPFQEPDGGTFGRGSPCPVGTEDGTFCRHIDTHSLDEIIAGQGGDGHNYFRSANPYQLTSTGLFGELYWNVTDTVKLTFGGRLSWDRKVFTPIPSQLLLADYRDLPFVSEGDPPPNASSCTESFDARCPFSGTAANGRGFAPLPDIVQEWIEPTGRFVVDWSPVLPFTDETLVYASYSRGYKGGGANPPAVAPPSGNITARSSGGEASPTFLPEYVNAYEVGTKNTLFDGALTLNLTGFYYNYKDYQVSKIVDRRAVNENFDAEIWGLELESMFAPTADWQLNASIGYLGSRIGDGESSIDLMDRALGGNTPFTTPSGITYEGYTVVKPWVTATSNCVVPTELVMGRIEGVGTDALTNTFHEYCPAGDVTTIGIAGGTTPVAYYERDQDGVWKFFDTVIPCGPTLCDNPEHDGRTYNPVTDAPNFGAGFSKDLSGNELPGAPQFTVSLGSQYSLDFLREWRATARVDWYWQGESYARVYNFEPYDRLKAWTNTNFSLWVTNERWGLTVEGYVKNAFDESPITGSFLNSDDSGLTTNVFTLDPRLVGLSVTKTF